MNNKDLEELCRIAKGNRVVRLFTVEATDKAEKSAQEIERLREALELGKDSISAAVNDYRNVFHLDDDADELERVFRIMEQALSPIENG